MTNELKLNQSRLLITTLKHLKAIRFGYSTINSQFLVSPRSRFLCQTLGMTVRRILWSRSKVGTGTNLGGSLTQPPQSIPKGYITRGKTCLTIQNIVYKTLHGQDWILLNKDVPIIQNLFWWCQNWSISSDCFFCSWFLYNNKLSCDKYTKYQLLKLSASPLDWVFRSLFFCLFCGA